MLSQLWHKPRAGDSKHSRILFPQHEGNLVFQHLSLLRPHLFLQILTEEELKGHQHATVIGGAKGFFGGLAVALPVSAVAQRRWAYYRSLPLSIKALGVVSVVVPAFVIAAEQAGHAFERQQWWGFQFNDSRNTSP